MYCSNSHPKQGRFVHSSSRKLFAMRQSQLELVLRSTNRSDCRRVVDNSTTPSASTGDASFSSRPTDAEDLEAGELRSESPEAAALQESQKLSQELAGRNLWERIKFTFTRGKLDKKRLTELGAGAFASYGFVSNSTYGPGLAIAWLAFMKKTGKSPLASGQWKVFLAFFAGFWTIQHFLRPLRFTLAIAMAPAFDRLITRVEKWTGLKRRPAFILYLVLYGILNFALVFGAILLFGGPKAFSRN